MYFIVNKENFVIAASEKFLQKIGARDICLISSMYRDGSVTVDQNSKELKIIPKDISFDIDESKLYSAFGELKHYRIYSKDDDVLEIKEEDNNSYLKKLKKGVIEKEDNEFDIPEIDTLKQDISTNIQKESETPIENVELKALMEDDTNTASSDIKDEIIESVSDDNKNTIAPIENIDENLEILEELKSIEPLAEQEKKEVQEENIEVKTEEKVNIPPIPLEKIKIKQEKKLNINTQKAEGLLEEDINIKPNLEDIKEIETPIKETRENEIQNNVTQDNNAQDNNIESLMNELLAVEENKVETNDQVEVAKKMVTIDTDNGDDEIDLDKKKKSSFFPWSKKSVKEEDKKEEVEEFPEIDVSKDEVIDEIKSIENPIENELLKEIEEPKKEELPNKPLEEKEKSNSEYDALEQALLELEAEEKNEAPTLKMESVSNTEEIEPQELIVKKSTTANEPPKGLSIIEKILDAQIKSLDLEDNAKYLNLDLTSYKMLLDSYIKEIETHKSDIYNRNNKTIDMLIDAGQLLNVDSLVHKLSKLKENSDEKSESIANEIEIYASLLKKKLSGDTEASANIQNNETLKAEPSEVQKVVKKAVEPVETKAETIAPIAEEKIAPIIDKTPIQADEIKKVEDEGVDEFLLVELTNDKELLNAVTPKEVTINIKHTAKELHLPENLVDEFIRDFDTQSKEHLPILIKACKNKDTKQLHETAHMLKGAATNLRLNQIADTLLKLQKEQDLDKVAQHIKKFAAYTKGLDIAIKNLESSDNENQK